MGEQVSGFIVLCLGRDTEMAHDNAVRPHGVQFQEYDVENVLPEVESLAKTFMSAPEQESYKIK